MTRAANVVGLGFSTIQSLQGVPLLAQTATATTLATAGIINSTITEFTTVGSGGIVILPAPTRGDRLTIINRGANTLTVYPPVNNDRVPIGTIDYQAIGDPITIAAGDNFAFEALSDLDYFTVGGAIGPTGPTGPAGPAGGNVATTTAVLKGDGSGNAVAATAGTDFPGLATANTYSGAQRASITALTDGATITPDFSANNDFSVTLGGNRTLANPTNIVAGQSGSIRIAQDATGGRTLSFGSYWKTAGGTAPSLSTAASAVDRLDYWVATTTEIHYALAKGVA